MVAPGSGRTTSARPPRRRPSRVKVALTAFVLTVALVVVLAGSATGAFGWLARSALYASGVYRDGGSSTLPPGFFDSASPSVAAVTPTETGRVPVPVLATASGGREPAAAALRARIAGLEDTDIGTPGWAVGDAATGGTIAGSRSGTAMIPASTLKLLTSLAALDAYGPEHRFATTVVSPRRGVVVLVGGGDPYLASARDPDRYPARASVDDLAGRVAAALKASGASTTALRLDYDASRFSGPAWNPTWPDGYRDQTTPTAALWSDEGRLGAGSPGPRTKDGPADAARAFAAALTARGLTVTLGTATTAPAGSRELARVNSMPLSEIVEQLLLHSDNDAAEVLFRQVGVAAGQGDRSGSITAARTAVERRLTALGVWTSKTRMLDGSGLSRDDRVEPETFLRVLELAMSPDRPQFRALLTGLPVAGSDGSLRYRFFVSGTSAARGDVHAKTGTLSGVHSLVGYATTRTGRTVAFAFLVNGAKNDYNARNWLDRAAAAVAGCGC